MNILLRFVCVCCYSNDIKTSSGKLSRSSLSGKEGKEAIPGRRYTTQKHDVFSK